tara:strand:+ start:64 stop:861 length:798 start_codon:yes stop_codon:yes gene_type:complete
MLINSLKKIQFFVTFVSYCRGIVFILYKKFKIKKSINFVSEERIKRFKEFKERNLDKYKPINISISSYQYNDITETSNKSSFFLYFINDKFFWNMREYSDAKDIIRKYSNIEENEISKYHLYPPNVLALDFIVNYLNNQNKFDVEILDFPSGIGNLLFYLSKHIEQSFLTGVDDFSQIKESYVMKYQSNTSRIKILKKIPNKNFYFCITTGIPLYKIIDEVISCNAKFFITESKYILFDNDLMNKVYKSYQLHSFNESISIFKIF